MSQIGPNNDNYDFSHYETDHGLLKETGPSIARQLKQAQRSGRKQPAGHLPPAELAKARPSEKSSSGWAIAGRVAVGILTAGVSELIRLAWRGIRSCCSSERPAPEHEPRVRIHGKNVASDPLPQSVSFNENVGLALVGSRPLPGGLEDAAREAFAELRGQFGTSSVPEGKPVRETLGSAGTNKLYASISALESDVTPEQIREWVLLSVKTKIARDALAEKLQASWPAGSGRFTVTLPDHALMRHPDLKERLMACRSQKELQGVLAEFEPRLQTLIELKPGLDILAMDARHQYVERLGKGLGAPNLSVSDLEFRPFNLKITKITDKILAGSWPGCMEEGFDAAQAVREAALEQADMRIREYETIRDADISDELKDYFRQMLLTLDKVEPGHLAVYVELGSKVDASGLMKILSVPDPDRAALQKEILALSEKLDAAFIKHYGAEGWHDLDGDIKTAIQTYAPLVALDKVPGLRRALADHPALGELSQGFSARMDAEDDPEYGIRIANIGGIARSMLFGVSDVDVRLKNLAQMGG